MLVNDNDKPATVVSREIKRSPAVVLHVMTLHSNEYIKQGFVKQFILAVVGGVFIGFGALLSVFLSVGVETRGPQELLTGLGFVGGFTMVVLLGASLFTEINVIIPVRLMSTRDRCMRCLFFWMLSFLGNLTGALLMGVVAKITFMVDDDQVDRLEVILLKKLLFKHHGVWGWFAVIVSAVVGNFLVGMAAFFATMGRTIQAKIFGLTFPVLMFVVLGVQHCPANLAFFSIGLIDGRPKVGWWESIGWVIVPSAIGNIIGGAVFVAILLWFTFITGHSYEFKPQRQLETEEEALMT